ncbi:hypothetical protein KL86DPRO_11538 [uncultured delta proteobacterium]|uniref:Uncharacterized protein n=1 Tax=uncultured delta proteobacterium TaxID=34034 RepID=A0A212JIB6_9DELT|nr:hypothetical protein KL86DPRO_11538 [uncultured delta proteobacterium]
MALALRLNHFSRLYKNIRDSDYNFTVIPAKLIVTKKAKARLFGFIKETRFMAPRHQYVSFGEANRTGNARVSPTLPECRCRPLAVGESSSRTDKESIAARPCLGWILKEGRAAPP